ncbi:hypothetical protein Pint_18441 [Pistacia integerrima]|uniref:Uncharacterized protein n=1 Tax=Pistacia integerrima TaxID=434235 RepID=A0ACC0YXQ5_9ROSI|nr:hypothetical protein Pint_18441 [Pistacia integerrima]
MFVHVSSYLPQRMTMLDLDTTRCLLPEDPELLDDGSLKPDEPAVIPKEENSRGSPLLWNLKVVKRKFCLFATIEIANRGNTQYGMEKLVGNNNYKYWRMCVEAYLQGQDLWELVTGADAGIPTDIPEHVESRRKGKIKWQDSFCFEDIYQQRIDADDKISETRLCRYLIGGLRKEYGPFVISIQRWSQQPSVKELENLLSNQEALAKQMAKFFAFDAVLFSKGKPNKKNTSA